MIAVFLLGSRMWISSSSSFPPPNGVHPLRPANLVKEIGVVPFQGPHPRDSSCSLPREFAGIVRPGSSSNEMKASFHLALSYLGEGKGEKWEYVS